MVSQAEFILKVITLWFLVLFQFFRDGMGPFKDARNVSMFGEQDERIRNYTVKFTHVSKKVT